MPMLSFSATVSKPPFMALLALSRRKAADAVRYAPKAPFDEGAGAAQAVTGGEIFLFLFLSLRIRLQRIHLPHQREACRWGGIGHSEYFLELPVQPVCCIKKTPWAKAQGVGVYAIAGSRNQPITLKVPSSFASTLPTTLLSGLVEGLAGNVPPVMLAVPPSLV